jgi:phenylacetic acid degradation protein/carnitine operon protein CaiE
MIAWKAEGTKLYQSLPNDMMQYWKACEPLRDETQQAIQTKNYTTWNEASK